MRTQSLVACVGLCMGGLVLSGCVMSEKYEAEKARSLNFQRLLAQEEKRTAELDADLKKTRRQLNEAEVRNRELSSDLQTLREDLASSQEQSLALKETSSLGEEPNMDLGAPEDDDLLAGFGFDEPIVTFDEKVPIYHEVMRGETLFRISRTYGVKVDQIMDWNNLRDDLIDVGQQLVVGYQ